MTTGDENTTRDSEQSDVEALSEALLASVEEDAETADESGLPDAVITALATMRKLGIDFVRRYHRLEIDSDAAIPGGPVLFVANHGFGGIFDLNVFAILATFEDLNLDRPVTALTHQIAWTLQVGRFIEPFGARPASRRAALEAFEKAEHVLVLPGGDIDAFKSFSDRDKIVFDGRTGFARLAMDAGVPIVPIVTAGAGESLFVLSDGKRLAKALRLDKLLRTKALPVSVSLPWGLNVGAVGLLPYLPLPTKLLTSVLPAMSPTEGETPAEFAGRVEVAMQKRLSLLARERRARSD
ncbi:1-acyl-sn-glycerol-3-phosphate acyltransferase [Marmoricola sp. OAE513]|uniref:lysophospholipid acyltransferase family protein n=1 Tax=Marmoricola sp. OAE513 TaxID=2817894 RepID=UPI001D856019